MSFFITGKHRRNHWYISPQSVVRRTAQLVKIVRNTHRFMPVVEVIQRAKVKLKMSLVLLRIALRNIVFIQHWMTGMNKGGCGLKEEETARLIIRQRKNRSTFSKRKNSVYDQLSSLSRYQPTISKYIQQI